MKTSELTGAALDWAVAKALGYTLYEFDSVDGKVFRKTPDGFTADFRIEDNFFSDDWGLGGPIIEMEKIGSLHEARGVWSASPKWDDPSKVFYGKTKLIAAMRCFVASKLGDEVEVPKELL